MARPLWNGIISFGLLNIPISLHAAERRTDLHFRMIDNRNKKPIRYERINAETGEEVPWSDIVQAFEYKKGNYVVLTKEEIDAAAPKGKDSIDIEAFVDRDAISPLYIEKPYYLIPGKKSEKGYALLRTILNNKRCAGIGYVIIRTRRYLSAVMAEGEALVLVLLRFKEEVVDKDDFIFPGDDTRELRISSREVEMATQLVESMTMPWDPASYQDDYRKKLIEVVEKRLGSNREIIQEAATDVATEAATNVVDFMSLLKQSLKNKESTGKTISRTKVTDTRKKIVSLKKKNTATKAVYKTSKKKTPPKNRVR